MQDVALPSCSNKNNRRMNKMPGYSSGGSVKSSHNESNRGWNEKVTGQIDHMLGESFKRQNIFIIYSIFLHLLISKIRLSIECYFFLHLHTALE